MRVPGRLHPVEVFYTQKPEPDYVEASVRTVVQIHCCEPPGDVLLFLTGEEEIEDACRKIGNEIAKQGKSVGPVAVYPLYSTLPPAQQQRISRPCSTGGEGRRPRGPQDHRLDKHRRDLAHDRRHRLRRRPRLCETKSLQPPVSGRVAAGLAHLQGLCAPARRARGPNAPGKCFRLYTEASFHGDLIEQTYPEILRSNLGSVVLQLKKLGVDDLVSCFFVDAFFFFRARFFFSQRRNKG